VESPEADRTFFVVGLGNPGREYAPTRHNAGFLVLEALRRRWSLGDGRRAFSGRLNDAWVQRTGAIRRVMLLEPHTYMNCAGQAVRAMLDFYKAPCRDLLVVLDDLALPVGRLRARPDGSAGGHNGLSDVLVAMGTDQVPRLRIGIGAPPPMMDPKDYVLSQFLKEEMETIRQAVEKAAEAVEDWAFRGIAYVMDNYNRQSDEEP